MAKRPNIILITTDQQRFDTIHAGGNCAILTPHLDWLCETGVRFTRAYSDCPICVPSRTTIMCGQHAWRHGLVSNSETSSPLGSRSTLPRMLTQAGYQTRAIGKMHFAPLRAHYGFEHMELLPDYHRWVKQQPGARLPMVHGLGQNEMEPALSDIAEEHSNTYWTVDRSINFLETRDETRPFFLWTSFSKPHPPLDPLPSYWSLYDGISLPEPWKADWNPRLTGDLAGFMQPTWMLSGAHRFSAERWQAVRRAYYACITQIDYNLGLLFARLRELKLLEDTWIVFTSDHGEMLGDHGMAAKFTFFEGSAHVPLILRAPGALGAPNLSGVTDDRLACLADLLPTCLAISGIDAVRESVIDGLDLCGLDRREELFCESNAGLAVIQSDGKKFQFSPHGGGCLAFDTANDPTEKNDLCASAPEIVASLRARLVHALRSRRHDAVSSGHLLPANPNPDPRELGRRAWRGFHHRDFQGDVLH